MSGKINIDELTIHKAFRLAQHEFPLVPKSAKGVHGNYATLQDCLQAVMPALFKYGLSLRQTSALTETGAIAETIISNDQGKELASGQMFVPALSKNGVTAQSVGSAETYARRYSVMAFCGLCPVDDDGQEASFYIDDQALLHEARRAFLREGIEGYKKFLTDLEDDPLVKAKRSILRNNYSWITRPVAQKTGENDNE